MSRTLRAFALSLCAPLILAGCNVGGTTNDTNSGFGLSAVFNPATETTLSAPVGGSNTATIQLTRLGTFVGDVTLTAEGVPSPLTVTFNPSVIPAGSTTSVMTFSVPAALSSGTTSFRLHATGTPNYDLQLLVPLTITN